MAKYKDSEITHFAKIVRATRLRQPGRYLMFVLTMSLKTGLDQNEVDTLVDQYASGNVN